MQTQPGTLAASIGEASARLEELREDLRNMPGFKVGSKWHLDRAAEKQRLMGRLDALRKLEWLSR